MAVEKPETDRGRSWMVAACCCFCNMTFYGVSRRLSGIMLVAATHNFQVSRASAAVPFSLSTAIRNLTGVFVGHLGHRFGVGPIVATGCFIASLGAGLCFFANDMRWLTVCWGGVFGIGFGLSTCLLPLAINQNFVRHNGTASGISYSGSYIGSFIFPPIVIWLLDSFGLQGTFLIISAAVLNVFVAAILLGKTKKRKPRQQGKTSTGDAERNCGVTSEQCGRQRFGANSNNCFEKNIAIISDSHIDASNYSKYVPPVCGSSFPKDTSESEQHIHESNNRSSSVFYIQTISFESEMQRQFKSDHELPMHQVMDKYSATYYPQDQIFASSYTGIPLSGLVLNDKNNSHYAYLDENRALDSTRLGTTEIRSDRKSCNRKVNKEWQKPSRSNLKAKYKLKLLKLKKVVVDSLRNRSCAKGELLNASNVQLLSFRHYQSFRGSAAKTPVPNEHDFTSPLNGIFYFKKSIRNRKKTHLWFKNKSSGESFTLPKHAESPGNSNATDSLRTPDPNTDAPRSQSLCQDTLPAVQARHKDISAKTLSIASKYGSDTHSRWEALRNCEHLNEKEDINSNKYIPDITSDRNCSCSVRNMSHLFPEQNGGIESGRGEREHAPNSSSGSEKKTKKCLPDWFRMFGEPMFIVIGFTMSIQTFIVVCVVTTIEDYAKDVGITESRGHYSLMALSTANLVGTLTLGAITDRGYMSRHRFLSLCFFGMSLSLVAVSLVAVSLPSLLAVVVIYGLLESGVVITFPIVTKQFVKGERRQAVAIASSNALSAPTVMLVPMLIGHFRDNIGCYSGLFHLLAATSFICSLTWLVAPSICKRIRKKGKQHLTV